jgi:hypothetical protein
MVRAKEYGWHQVAAATVYASFGEIVANAEPMFALLKNGLLARQSSDEVVQMIQLSAGKGGSYGFRWGVSLGFIPHEWSPRPRFHRTLKSARLDLFEEPFNFLIADHCSGEGWDYLVDGMHGESCMRRDMLAAWSKLQPVIDSFFNALSSLDGVLRKANEHATKSWQSFRHHPDPKVVQAFTLARLGRLPEAEGLLSSFVAEDKGFECPQDLLAALRKTLN